MLSTVPGTVEDREEYMTQFLPQEAYSLVWNAN